MILAQPRLFVLQGPPRRAGQRRLRQAQNAPPDVRTATGPTRGIMPYSAPAGSSITGSGAATTTPATGAGVGALIFSGSCAATTATPTAAAAGALVFAGACAATTASATAAGAGAQAFAGSCAATTTAASGVGAGALVFVGSCAATTAAPTCAGAGGVPGPAVVVVPPLGLAAHNTSTDLDADNTTTRLAEANTATEANVSNSSTHLVTSNTQTELVPMAEIVRVATDSADIYSVTCQMANGSVYDLTDCTLDLQIRSIRPGGTGATLAMTVVSAAAGTAKYEWDGTELVPGEYEARVVVTTADSKTLTFPQKGWKPLRVVA